MLGRLDYANAMRNVFLFTNMSAGANKHCVRYHSMKPAALSDLSFNVITDESLLFLDSNGTNMYPTLANEVSQSVPLPQN
jgi:hypothetical protein